MLLLVDIPDFEYYLIEDMFINEVISTDLDIQTYHENELSCTQANLATNLKQI